MKGETEITVHRLKLRRGRVVLGLSMTYPAVTEAMALSCYIRNFMRAVVSQSPWRGWE